MTNTGESARGASGAHEGKRLTKFERMTPEEQEAERRKIKEAVAQKMKEKEKIIASVRANLEKEKGHKPNEDDFWGKMEFDMGARFEHTIKDYGKARECYERAIEKEHELAMFNLGTWFLEGKYGTPKDEKRARELFEISAAKGCGMAKINLGFMYQNGIAGLDQDMKKAFQLYKDGIEDQRNYGGDGHALLAFMYGTGSGGEKDMAQARAQLALAEEKGARIHPGLKELVMGSPDEPGSIRECQARRWRLWHALDSDRASCPKTDGQWASLLSDHGYALEGSLEQPDRGCATLDDFLIAHEAKLRLASTFSREKEAVPAVRCEHCKKAGEDMAKCSKCGGPFCNKACQKEGWAAHKTSCRLAYVVPPLKVSKS